MKKLIFILTLIFVTISAFCQLTIEYIDGYLDLKDGNEWTELWIGDQLEESDTVRLAEASIAEITNGSATITITREGTYKISDLIVGANRRSSIVGLIGNKLRTMMIEDEAPVTSAVAGVRASEAVEKDVLSWAFETSDSMLEEGIFAFEDGYYEDAIYAFDEAIYIAEEENNIQLQLYANLLVGICWIQLDDFEAAEEYLDIVIEIDSESEEAVIAAELLEEGHGN